MLAARYDELQSAKAAELRMAHRDAASQKRRTASQQRYIAASHMSPVNQTAARMFRSMYARKSIRIRPTTHKH